MRPGLGGKVRGFAGGVDCGAGVGTGGGEGRAEAADLAAGVSSPLDGNAEFAAECHFEG